MRKIYVQQLICGQRGARRVMALTRKLGGRPEPTEQNQMFSSTPHPEQRQASIWPGLVRVGGPARARMHLLVHQPWAWCRAGGKLQALIRPCVRNKVTREATGPRIPGESGLQD